MIDLHIHSNYSDSTNSIEDILKKAESLGLSQIAITDHNTIDGSLKASQISNIDLILGIELSVVYHGTEVHLLGYFPNGSDFKNIQFIIKEAETNKRVAILEMLENLNAMGIDIQINELREFTKGMFNRVHICQAMIKHGYIQTVDEGFRKYVGDDCPAYVPRRAISLKEACEAIHQDHGIAVIAHPYEYDDLYPIDKFLNEIIDLIDGIECYHPSANNDQIIDLKEIAINNQKMITGGSDDHGTNKENIVIGMMRVPDEYKIIRD